MRPVNLIPPEERRGERAPLRTGALSYVIVAALAVALLGGHRRGADQQQISDHEAEKSRPREPGRARQRPGGALAPYAEFASLQQAREQTVASLAQSRFDWERVLRELALVIPEDVWLTNLTGTVSPEVSQRRARVQPGARAGTASWARRLEISGCAAGHDAVAGFLAALEDIDGVTRVGRAELGSAESRASSIGCEAARRRLRRTTASTDFISAFEVVGGLRRRGRPPPGRPAPPRRRPRASSDGRRSGRAVAEQTRANAPTSSRGWRHEATDRSILFGLVVGCSRPSGSSYRRRSASAQRSSKKVGELQESLSAGGARRRCRGGTC